MSDIVYSVRVHGIRQEVVVAPDDETALVLASMAYARRLRLSGRVKVWPRNQPEPREDASTHEQPPTLAALQERGATLGLTLAQQATLLGLKATNAGHLKRRLEHAQVDPTYTGSTSLRWRWKRALDEYERTGTLTALDEGPAHTLRARRKAKGLTQKALGLHLGVGRGIIDRWERLQEAIPAHYIPQIETILGPGIGV